MAAAQSAAPGHAATLALARKLNCLSCHGEDGTGQTGLPPLWGLGSYNKGAGMANIPTAAAFIKRLFEAGAITRVLFLVDRIPLAKQTEDAFAEHLSDFPAYV